MLEALQSWNGAERAPETVLTGESLCRGLGAPPEVIGFQHLPVGEVAFGPGSLNSLGAKARALGGSRALLVTDPGLRCAGHEGRAMAQLQEAGLAVTVFDDVRENPTTLDVDRAVAAARAGEVDLIVGLGGGSSMDTAKGANFLLSNGGKMQDYWGAGKAARMMLPFIAIPTTAGTGSECQSFALIADEETHQKMACGDWKAAAAVAILDPELTLTQPRRVTACTGIDAIAHAVETAVCCKRTAISNEYSRLAFALLDGGFAQVLRQPEDLEARAKMLLGAAYAGAAIENSMLGAAHSAANPLTARFGIAHGQAVGLMLPHVVRFNRADSQAAAIYDALCPGLEERLSKLLELAGLGAGLRVWGVGECDFEVLASEAQAQWTAQFNPVEVRRSDFEQMYRCAC